MNNAQAVIRIALAEVGYREKASNASLDDPAANTGTANRTKYARDLAAAGYYNGDKNGAPWCDVFVDWCFFKAFGAAEGQSIQCQTGDLGAACGYSAQYYQAQGRYDRSPQPGDQIFFLVSGSIGHTGIVTDVTETAVTVVEGNSSDRVQKLTYPRNSTLIAGYGHPKYDDPVEPKVSTEPSDSATITLPLLRRGIVFEAVANAQALLIRRGYACGGRILAGREVPDGDFGPMTENAVRAFQTRNGLIPDGEIGADTWTALLTT